MSTEPTAKIGSRWPRWLALPFLINATLSIPGSLAYIIAAAMAFDAPGSTNDPTAWLGALLMLSTPVVVITDAMMAYRAFHHNDARWLAGAIGLFIAWCLLLYLLVGFPPYMAFPGPMIVLAYFDA